jgi:hypothetical protein
MNSRLERDLAEVLRELEAHQPPPLDLDAVIRRGRVLRRRRIAGPSAGAAVVVAGAAAIALAVSSGPVDLTAHQGGAAGSPTAAGAARAVGAASNPSTAVAAGVPSATVLKMRLTAAYAAAKATLKVTDVSTAFGETTETITVPSQKWSETINWNHSGVKESLYLTTMLPAPERLTLTVYNGNNQKQTLKNRLFWVFKTLSIDYTTHRYSTGMWYADAGKTSEQKVVAQEFVLPQPESLKTSSWSRLVGTATVDGQRTYVLSQTGSGGVTATTWVNQRTLLPVKDVVHTYVGTSTDTYAYSTAFGATAAANTPAIPRGFTREG